MNPWLAVLVTAVVAFALHLLMVLAFRSKN